MKTYEIRYTVEKHKTETVSPFTGKPYVKPLRRTDWIELSEYVEAESLGSALALASARARAQKWRVDAVQEVPEPEAEHTILLKKAYE